MNRCIVTSNDFANGHTYYGKSYRYRPCAVSPFTNVHLKTGNKWKCFWMGFTSLDKKKKVPSPTVEFPKDH